MLRRNKFSNRSLNFIKRNSLENIKTIEYVTSLASNVFKISNFEFTKIYNNTALCIILNKNKYYFILDKEYIELQLYRNRLKIKSFQGDSCWYQGLKFFKNNIPNPYKEKLD